MVTLQALTALLLVSGVGANGTPDNVSSRLQVQVRVYFGDSYRVEFGVLFCQHNKGSWFNFRLRVELRMFSTLILE